MMHMVYCDGLHGVTQDLEPPQEFSPSGFWVFFCALRKVGRKQGCPTWSLLGHPEWFPSSSCCHWRAVSSIREQVKGLLSGLTKEKGDAAITSAFSVYSVHWGWAPDPAIVKKTVADIETDFLFLVPTQIALQLHANNTR
ncbi:hypothetical protein AMECASPLE_032672 [Ameca splendens]|uniref:Uncharacterized protein n=1 Tax=Ameca splendens TaxID=208324 RepID=A0ABV0ZFE9_9TELE